MSAAREVLVHPGKDALAQAAADRLTARLSDAQAARGTASVVLTGGRNGNALLAALAASPEARERIDWSRLDVWWGDERFLPEGDPERNHTQAHEALLDAVPLDPARVHAMPPSDGRYAGDAEAAAEAYATELAAAGGDPAVRVPSFDVLLLGVGPDTHVASLFPEHPALRETERTVVGVHGAPKPPPVRLTLTLPAIRAAEEVWLLAAGEDKADAVALALSGPGELQAPAAAAYGRSRTLWFLDEAAASRLPADA
ncbi:6-phosphogluconolactonase [Streptomyces sp. 891-h]|uniref:6-phosphogluconolactonase n=1 Tax=Streptomyces sp. 891-h TaxID=2720714 RepID=UPI001FA982E8|nr:6-phosphogluconolactonase [Streptomyces sp. 891-h]UNZ20010.1 6-phosphogluconolactonase [Streptomyces sp. 891-h]